MGNKGSIFVGSLLYDFTVPVTSASWVQISASLGFNANALEIIHKGDNQVYLGYGPAGSEVTERIIDPNGNTIRSSGLFNTGMRIALKAVGADCASGTLVINFFR